MLTGSVASPTTWNVEKKSVPPWTELRFYTRDRQTLTALKVGDEFIDHDLEDQVAKIKVAGMGYVDYSLTKLEIEQAQLDLLEPVYDVIRIRDRWFDGDKSLSEVLDFLDANGLQYPRIHCFFCRSLGFIANILTCGCANRGRGRTAGAVLSNNVYRR